MYKKTTARRWQLLTTVSAVALLGSAGGAMAAGEGKPVLWIEAGGQLERLRDNTEPFEPPFLSQLLDNPFTPPGEIQAPPRYSIGEEGRISFSPEGSDWVFSVGLRYGRANRNGNKHEESTPPSVQFVESIPYFSIDQTGHIPAAAQNFVTTVSQTHSTDMVLDFEAGKDVGLGLLGSHGSSTLSGGIRFAQFTSRSTAKIDSDPDFTVSYKYITTIAGYPAYIKFPKQNWDLYEAKMNVSRSFKGFGPSLKWDGNTVLVGNPAAGAITFDWGVNGAVLFGRQSLRAHHETMAHHGSAQHASGPLPTNYSTPHHHDTQRARSVAVPNIGGFAGLSLRYTNAKISAGYRADFFFNAIDGGMDTRKTEARGFFGPFASISFGLGD